MKKYKNKLLLLVVIIAAITSCKKGNDSNNPPTTGTIVGFWAGTGVANGVTQPASIVFKSNGTMRFYNGVSKASDTASLAAASKSDATYTLSGTNISTTYSISGISLLLAATANSSFTSMTGTAGFPPANTGVGTFTFTKM